MSQTIIEHDGKRYEAVGYGLARKGNRYLSLDVTYIGTATSDWTNAADKHLILRELPPDKTEPEVRWERTGEFRAPRDGEWYEVKGCCQPERRIGNWGGPEQAAWILSRIEVEPKQPPHPLPWRPCLDDPEMIVDANDSLVGRAAGALNNNAIIHAANALGGTK